MPKLLVANEQHKTTENKNEHKQSLLQERELYKKEWDEANQNGGKLQLHTEQLKDLLGEEFPPEVWVVDQLIPDEGVTLLAGFPGTFKTWLYMYIAVKVSKGEPVFGRFNTKQTGVLVIDEESGRRRLQKRFKQLGATKDTPIHFMSRVGYKMNNLYADAIQQKAHELGAGLVVFDSFTRFNGNGDENASGDMAKLMDFYRQLADAGIAVLILHHNRKDSSGGYNAGQAMRGSSDILASGDCHLALTRSGQSQIVKLEQTKNRDSWEQAPIKLRFQPNASEFEFVGTDKTAAEKEAEIIEGVLGLVHTQPGTSQTGLKVLAASKNITVQKDTVRILEELEKKNKIKSKRGNGSTLLYYPS